MASKVNVAVAKGDPTPPAIEPYSKHIVRTNGRTRSKKGYLVDYPEFSEGLRSGKMQEELCEKPKPT